MKNFLFNTAIGIIAMMLAACATKPAPLPSGDAIRKNLRNKKSVSVLFIGNSLSFGLPKELEKIARKNGVNCHATQQAHSGWSLARHSRNPETLRVLRGNRWDIVVLQEQSRIPSQPIKRHTHMVPAVAQLARESRAVDAMPVLYQSWGYRDGDERRFHDDFFAMNQRLREGCHAAARVEGLPIARVGDAWENEMVKGRGARLFMPDGLHPSRDGVRLNAQVFYEAFFAHQAAPKNRKMRLNAAKPTRNGG
ncbi:MAG: SGNH/GDSL hydrolase family protein [Verrucomicrobia bacterium]|nr:SGNH/GDSL hydrolase family protein [Verrucomicrobiota bacterium]